MKGQFKNWANSLFTLALLFVTIDTSNAIEIKAEINRDRIYLGESFILQLSINGCSELNNISFQNAKDCTIKQLGSQKFSNYSVSIVNGKVSRREFVGIVANYEITPTKAGTFDIGEIIIEVDGKKYTHTIPSVIVTDIEKQDVVKIFISASQETALIDEPFEITLAILIKRLPGNMSHLDPLYSDSPPSLSIPWLEDQKIANLKGTDVQTLLNQLLVPRRDQPGIYINNYTVRSDPFADPFDFSSFFEPKKAKFILPRKIVETNGISYFEYSIKFKYSSKDEGNFVFGPAVFKGDVPVVPSDGAPVTPFRVFAIGKAATVRVTPPPEEGRPPSFIGAIGSNMFLKATLDVNECYVGDPIQLTLTLTGAVRFDKIFPPFITNQSALTDLFTVYEDSLKIDRSTNAIQFTYTIRPKKEGSYFLPPIEMAYFDTLSRSYKKVFSETVPINVKRGKEITAQEVITSTNLMKISEIVKKDPASLPIVTIKQEVDALSSYNFIPEQRWHFILLSGPIIYLTLVLGQNIFAYRHKLQKRRLKQHAYHKAVTALKQLGKHSPTTLKEQSSMLCKIIATFISEKFDLKTEGITPPDLEKILRKIHIKEEVITKLTNIFEINFNNAFSNSQELKDISVFEEMKEELQLLLKKMEDVN